MSGPSRRRFGAGAAAEVSDEGRAPRNTEAVFALAMAAGHPDPETRKLALRALPAVCRIGTHLFQFATFVEQFRDIDFTVFAATSSVRVQLPAYGIVLDRLSVR